MTTAASPALAPADSLVGALPPGALDIIGDVHGEWEALQQLLAHLGYNAQGRHPQGRTLVFVGDLCDRGPDTPAVLDWFCDTYEAGHCHAVMGNHEVNLIREDAKDGAGWYFDARTERDRAKYAPFAIASPAQRERYMAVCSVLPIALERDDLRVVHAAWRQPQIDAARRFARGSARRQYDVFEDMAAEAARNGSLQRRIQQEKTEWPHDIENGAMRPPLLAAHGERELLKQMTNPLKVLTTGVERAASAPFYAGGKWRFTERMPWWNDYDDDKAVVVGHYWRQWLDLRLPGQSTTVWPDPDATDEPKAAVDGMSDSRAEGSLFAGVPANGWHGQRRNVFCVDYSVGARWSERLQGRTDPGQSRFHLAAMRWPERQLMLETGESFDTVTAY